MSKKLTRTDDTDAILAGVCGGLAKYFNLDVLLVRILWIVFGAVSAGSALIIYLILALVVDVEPKLP